VSNDQVVPGTRRMRLEPLTRRAVLATGGAVTASGTALLVAGCSVTYEPLPTAPESSDATATPDSGGPDDRASSGASPGVATGTDATGTVLGPASNVPVGGGTIYDAEKVVVTQPSAGSFKAFSAICTHMRCLLSEVSDGTIYCPCHGSKFNITDGSVVVGPATQPLTPLQVTDDDETLRLG
jgi:Rieske Fe-S protein